MTCKHFWEINLATLEDDIPEWKCVNCDATKRETIPIIELQPPPACPNVPTKCISKEECPHRVDKEGCLWSGPCSYRQPADLQPPAKHCSVEELNKNCTNRICVDECRVNGWITNSLLCTFWQPKEQPAEMPLVKSFEFGKSIETCECGVCKRVRAQ